MLDTAVFAAHWCCRASLPNMASQPTDCISCGISHELSHQAVTPWGTKLRTGPAPPDGAMHKEKQPAPGLHLLKTPRCQMACIDVILAQETLGFDPIASLMAANTSSRSNGLGVDTVVRRGSVCAFVQRPEENQSRIQAGKQCFPCSGPCVLLPSPFRIDDCRFCCSKHSLVAVPCRSGHDGI